MAWSTHPTVVVGQTWSASDENTYVKGNLDTLWPYTAALQVAYSTSTTSLAVATSTAALQVLRCNSSGTALEFGNVPVIYRRQSQSTDWFSTSTSTTVSNYTPTSSVIQAGSLYDASGSTRSVTFPVVFTTKPMVFPQVLDVDAWPYVYAVSTSGFNYRINLNSTSGYVLSTGNYSVVWFAVGEV